MIEVVDPYRCVRCPLIECSGLNAPSEAQRSYLQEFKQREIRIQKGEVLLHEGTHGAHLFTLLDGALLRYQTLEDGRRQIVNVLFPGDFVGLQGAFDEPLDHSVEALMPARLCVFDRSGFTELVKHHPMLGYDVIWLAAKENTALEQHLVSLGRRNAKERVVYLAVWLLDRASATGMTDDPTRVSFAITQTQISDMLGLSLVHTNRTIRALDDEGLVNWRAREIVVPDLKRAVNFANYETSDGRGRPYI